MKYRFIDALNNFLGDIGRLDLINPNLDSHSVIQLEMNNAPAINIDLSNDEVVLWSTLSEHTPALLETVSFNLLNYLLEFEPNCFCLGQPALRLVNGEFILWASMKNNAVHEQKLFADSFEEFFVHSNNLNMLLKM